MELFNFLKKHSLLIFIIFFTILLRLGPIWGGNFSFMYDNAKDALVIREMGLHLKPALFGAVTSIDGVYNGPLWYYLALPFNIIGAFHPFSNVLMVIFLSVLSVILLYLRVGKFEAFLYAVSFGLIGSQQSAWTPYMTPFIVLPILIILLEMRKNYYKKYQLLLTKQLTLLFLLVSFVFHFQTAFAIVLLPTVLIILYLFKLKISKRQIWFSLAAFLIPWTPFVIFELRHKFHQTKQIIKFIANYGEQSNYINPNASGLTRVLEISNYIYQSLWQAVTPAKFELAGFVILFLLIIYLFAQSFFKKHQRLPILKRIRKLRFANKRERVIFSSFILVPLIFYLILPCKSYYLIALMPLWIIIFATLVRNWFRHYVKLIVGVFLILSLLDFKNHLGHAKVLAQTESFFFGPKYEAVEKVYELSEGKPFASYHFVKEVYDYTYQYIYLYSIDQGRPIPVEFSYAPGETLYIPQKHIQAKKQKPEYIFLIVEDYYSQQIFEQWWLRVASELEIIEEYEVNAAIKIYKTAKINISSKEVDLQTID